METSQIQCPKCGSTQLTANKKGFSGKKAVVGGILTGGLGLMAGTIGSNKIIITCLACGNEFRPGSQTTTQNSNSSKPQQPKVYSKSTWVFTRFFTAFVGLFFLIMSIVSITQSSWGLFVVCLLFTLFFYVGFTNANKKIKEIKESNNK